MPAPSAQPATLKYRKITVFNLGMDCRIFSAASLDSPYGLIGWVGVSSVRAIFSTDSPYTAAVLENTILWTPSSARVRKKIAALSLLLPKYFDGFFTDSPTSINAAKCIAATGLYLRHS